MGITVGPADWWIRTPEAIRPLAISCPLGTILPDGSRLVCREGGVAWIVAPCTTQVSQTWGNYACCGFIDNFPTGVSCHPQITDTNWVTLYNCLISRGFNPGDWFVPNVSQLQNAGYACRFFWDSFSGGAAYATSVETNSTAVSNVCFNTNGSTYIGRNKSLLDCVRAFRCVTF